MSGAGMTIKELFTSWGFQVDDKALDALDRRLDKVKASVKAVGEAAIAAAAGIFGLATFTANAGNHIAKAADKVGMGIEAFQEFEYAADKAGTGAEQFENALRFFLRNLSEARSGAGPAADAFFQLSRAIGVDLVKAGKPAEETLMDVAEGFRKIADPTKRVELAMDLFGREGSSMINVLSKGRDALREQREEARALGGVLSEQAARAAERFHDRLVAVRFALTGLRNTIGSALFPMMTKLINRFMGWISVNKAWIALRTHEVVGILADYLGRVAFVARRVAEVTTSVVHIFGGWNRVLRLITTGLLLLLGLRVAAFLGGITQAILAAAKAFTMFGEAGLLANIEIVAIGAAILGLLLIIEDVVGYFQGKKSITGLFLSNFEGMSAGLDKWIDGMLGRVKAFGEKIGRSIANGIANMSEADWKKVGTNILHALQVMLELSELPLLIGMAIATGILDGLEAGLKKRMPRLAALLFPDDDKDDVKKHLPIEPQHPESEGRFDRLLNMAAGGSLSGDSLVGLGAGALADFFKAWSNLSASGKYALPSPGEVAGAAARGMAGGGTPASVSVTIPQTITVGPGASPADVKKAARDGAAQGARVITQSDLNAAHAALTGNR